MKIIIASLACLLATSAVADEYVTYKKGANHYGPIAYQIDTTTIRREGPYRVFWNRIWEFDLKQPVSWSLNEGIVFLSQKFAVDCVHRRFGPDFIDSNIPAQHRKRANLDKMRWEALTPVMAKTVCGEK